jgi:hypothetical protein
MTPNQKTQIDNFTKDLPLIDVIKFVQHRNDNKVINNADDFKDYIYLASMLADEQMLVKKDDVYYLITAEFIFSKDSETTIDLRIENAEEDDTDNYCLDVYNEDIDDMQEREDLTIADCIIYSFEEKLYEEANAALMYTQEEALKYNLI